MQSSHERGFSLVELLIVVVVVGIIAALSVPLYKKAITASENSSTFSLVRVMHQQQTGFFSSQSRYARLDEMNQNYSNNFGAYHDNSLLRGKYTFTMSPVTPTDAQLKQNFTIIATRTLDNVDVPYVISVDASGEIVQITP